MILIPLGIAAKQADKMQPQVRRWRSRWRLQAADVPIPPPASTIETEPAARAAALATKPLVDWIGKHIQGAVRFPEPLTARRASYVRLRDDDVVQGNLTRSRSGKLGESSTRASPAVRDHPAKGMSNGP